jgi:hypothetical protein
MATTGAPWNLFYPLGTDLVRDGAGDIQQLAEGVAAGLTLANTGIGTNAVQAVKTDVFTTTSTTYTDVTGLAATLTPGTATSKVLIIVQVVMFDNNGVGANVSLSGGNSATYIGDADGSRVRAAFGFNQTSSFPELAVPGSVVYLDSPASTSPVTYQVRMRAGLSGGTVGINRSRTDGNNAANSRSASSITVIEVAA